MTAEIVVTGARTHNLRNISVKIPKNRFCVITGLSGSGKSSLAFDTLYAEGQRKYVESLSAYARQFLDLMDKPDVDSITGLSPAISIEQKATSHNPRSTVGTITEIYDYLRLLYARTGIARCPQHRCELKAQTVKQMTAGIMALPPETKIMILAPVVRNRKGEYRQLLGDLARQGYIRARIDGENCELSDPPDLDLHKKHTIEVIIDRMRIKATDEIRQRTADALELALKMADGRARAVSMDNSFPDMDFSAKYACPVCNYTLTEIEPRNFSFNNPNGACPECDGLGVREVFIPESFILDKGKSLNEGAIKYWGPSSSYNFSFIKGLSEKFGFSLDTPLKDLSPEDLHRIFYGTGTLEIKISFSFGEGEFRKTAPFEGVIPNFTRKYQEASDKQKEDYTKYLTTLPCSSCQGTRLREGYRHVFLRDTGGQEFSISSLGNQTIRENLEFFNTLELTEQNQKIASRILREIKNRLTFLINVGLDYLTLNRSSETLSGGESQRIRLASQIGSGLTGVMYVLDEPSIGLHERDNSRLLESLFHLRDLGNSVIVVEHDENTIRKADHIIDMGPGAGIHGGSVIAAGTVAEIIKVPESLTGQYLSGRKTISVPARKKPGRNFLVLSGASGNNLKNVTLKIPAGLFTCITGVSGSGKSTLINDTLFPAAERALNGAALARPAPFAEISGLNYFDKVISIDQSPIGRTPRSNPATYIDLFTPIRSIFADTREARARGYQPGRFSFNVKGGRCEACQGAGLIKVEMNFLPDVYVECEECRGKRYNPETLDIEYKGKNINDVLNMTAEEALEFFQNYPVLKRKLETLRDVGLSYITLGQSATTFSGGEAQRIKLARELSRPQTGSTLYILDEPTTGLHFHDVQMLLSVLFRLRDLGNTVVVIEHNMDMIKSADYIVDMGPEGGDRGGMIIAAGSPEEIAKDCHKTGSYTGQFLKNYLK